MRQSTIELDLEVVRTAAPPRNDFGAGKYDALYLATPMLWPPHPGRMVIAACELRAGGRALDLGCGDGKNIAFLCSRGWDVDGIDVSREALHRARARLEEATSPRRYRLHLADVATFTSEGGPYDLVIAYGLFHCLDDRACERVALLVDRSLESGGLLAYAAFTDELPVPSDHATGDLFLRSRQQLSSWFGSWRQRCLQFGRITETHPPMVAQHQHALVWALLEKP